MLARILRVTLIAIRILVLLGAAAYVIWAFPPPTICPQSEPPASDGRWLGGSPMLTERSELAAAELTLASTSDQVDLYQP